MPRVKWIGFLLTVAKVWTVVCRRLLPYVVFLCAKYEGGLLKRSAYSLAVLSIGVSYATCTRCFLECEPGRLNLLKILTITYFSLERR